MQEGGVDTDALALELKEVVFFGVPAEAVAGVDAFEVDLSLCVFGKIGATDGREFEIDASAVDLGKSLFMSGLATHMWRRTEEARCGWLAVGSRKTSKNANEMHSDGSGCCLFQRTAKKSYEGHNSKHLRILLVNY